MIANNQLSIQPIRVLFEDDDLIVIDKPAGVIVNRADTTANAYTIQDWAEKKLKSELEDVLEKDETDFSKRGGIVHRLDKQTSGLLIIAKNPESFISLQNQFKQGLVEKEYIALVHGKVLPEQGVVDAPIGRLPWNRTRFGVLPAGRLSKTLYKVLKYYKDPDSKGSEIVTLIELHPKTGRTHQIRVHMQYLGFPLFSDELYAGRKQGKKDRRLLPRHFLHASEITFTHPTTGATIALKSNLPQDLQNMLRACSSL